MKEGTRKIFDSLKFCNYKLNFVLDITQKIIENKSTPEILNFFSDFIVHNLSIKQIVFYIKEENKWQLIHAQGVNKFKFANLDVEQTLGKYQEITMIRGIEEEQLGQLDFVIPVVNRGQVLAYLLVGDLEDRSLGMSPTVKNLKFVQTVANIIVLAMDKKRLILKAIERERMKKELETAAKLQRMLIPDVSKISVHNEFRIASYYLPHFELGGDFYDVMKLSDDEYYFAIADVSGKGLSAALFMAYFQANLRAQFRSNISLEEIIENLNEMVNEHSEDYFVTLFIGKYNVKKRRLIYVNAGHHWPIFYDTKTKEIQYLKKGCIGIGMNDYIPSIEIAKIIVKNPSKLLLYTDGVIETKKHEQDQLRLKKLEQIVASDLDINQTIDKIIEELNLKKENSLLFDDASLLGIEFC